MGKDDQIWESIKNIWENTRDEGRINKQYIWPEMANAEEINIAILKRYVLYQMLENIGLNISVYGVCLPRPPSSICTEERWSSFY